MRIPPQGIEMLAQRPFFAGLSRKELESVAALGATLEIPANQVLTKEGAIGEGAFQSCLEKRSARSAIKWGWQASAPVTFSARCHFLTVIAGALR